MANELTVQEKLLADVIAQLIKKGTEKKPLPSSLFIEEVNRAYEEKELKANRAIQKTKLTGQRFRAIVNYLRNSKKHPILSNSKGYYWARNKNEIIQCAKRLKSRIESQVKTLKTFQEILNSWEKR